MEPTAIDLLDPVFDAIWDAIRKWDVSTENNGTYSGPTGTDVMAILVPVRVAMREKLKSNIFEALGSASMCWSETPKGVFESTRAKEIGDKLVALI